LKVNRPTALNSGGGGGGGGGVGMQFGMGVPMGTMGAAGGFAGLAAMNPMLAQAAVCVVLES